MTFLHGTFFDDVSESLVKCFFVIAIEERSKGLRVTTLTWCCLYYLVHMRLICDDQTEYVWPAVLDIINIMNMQYIITDIANFTRRWKQYNCVLLSHQTRQNYSFTTFFFPQVECSELPKDKCFSFQVAARQAEREREWSLASLGNPDHLVYDLYLFTSDLWYRNDKSKNF